MLHKKPRVAHTCSNVIRRVTRISAASSAEIGISRSVSHEKDVSLLVSTYVVCERLSVMHEPAGVVENLVQILQFTPILQYRIPPPGNENCQKSWHFDFSVADYPPPPKN